MYSLQKFTPDETQIDEIRQAVEDAKRRRLTFMLVGRAGVGKSSTVNTLLGSQIAPVGDYTPTTAEVCLYPGEVNGINFTVVDTPGLCDDLEEADNDTAYMRQMAAKAPPLDCIWFVTRLDDTRVTGDEKRAIRLLSKTFGKRFWERAIIVFTFSNQVPAERFERALSERSRLIRAEIARYVSQTKAARIPAVAVDNLSPVRPDGREWLGELFTVVVERIRDKGALPFMLAMAKSIARPPRKDGAPKKDGNLTARIVLDHQQIERVKKRLDGSLIGGGALAGAAIGSLFGPVGTVVGGAVGAIAGILGSLWG